MGAGQVRTKQGLNSLNKGVANPHSFGISLFSLLFSPCLVGELLIALRLNKIFYIYRLFSPKPKPAPEAKLRTKQATKHGLNSLKHRITSQKARVTRIL